MLPPHSTDSRKILLPKPPRRLRLSSASARSCGQDMPAVTVRARSTSSKSASSPGRSLVVAWLAPSPVRIGPGYPAEGTARRHRRPAGGPVLLLRRDPWRHARGRSLHPADPLRHRHHRKPSASAPGTRHDPGTVRGDPQALQPPGSVHLVSAPRSWLVRTSTPLSSQVRALLVVAAPASSHSGVNSQG